MADTTLSAGIPACNTNMPAVREDDSNRDAPILAAFARWQALHVARGTLSDSAVEAEHALWDAIDEADKLVQDLPAVTPAGIAGKLWIAITHNTQDHEGEAAAFRGDLEWFEEQAGAIDWNIRCIVSALRALKTMEG